MTRRQPPYVSHANPTRDRMGNRLRVERKRLTSRTKVTERRRKCRCLQRYPQTLGRRLTGLSSEHHSLYGASLNISHEGTIPS
jgi:hypothetical protein